MLRKTLSGVSAGVMISIGGAVYLACENKIVGAVLFTVALLTICIKGYSLYTGKIGFIPEKHDAESLSTLFLGLLGNTIGTLFCGLIIRFGMPSLGETAEVLCTAKLVGQSPLSTLVRGIFCGILMYIAVSIYREKWQIVGILFAIPVFILAGFEHSIADMFYFTAAGFVNWRCLPFVALVLIGNSLGSMLLPTLNNAWAGKKEAAAPAVVNDPYPEDVL
ncbi:MAG: formate/nitrite transporter family protein [Clostridia bacterium]|nr:formate/nitrite transporter family protein [Clostridia bacterium]